MPIKPGPLSLFWIREDKVGEGSRLETREGEREEKEKREGVVKEKE